MPQVTNSVEFKSTKFRDRKFALLLYPDDDSHMKALETIKKSYDYACILHDKDTDENGELKKSHYHVLIRWQGNVRWNTSIASELEIAENYIQKVKNFDKALEYLIHLNDADKYQYTFDDVTGTMNTRLKQLMSQSDKSEGEKVVELIEYIENQEGHISIKDFSKYCAVNGYWSEFRRSGSIFLKVIEEHNRKVMYNLHAKERSALETMSIKTRKQANELQEDYNLDERQVISQSLDLMYRMMENSYFH